MNTTEAFKHKAVVAGDEDFLQSLTDYLSQGSGIQATAPVFYKADGSIDRAKTLELHCYGDFQNGL